MAPCRALRQHSRVPAGPGAFPEVHLQEARPPVRAAVVSRRARLRVLRLVVAFPAARPAVVRFRLVRRGALPVAALHPVTSQKASPCTAATRATARIPDGD